MTRLSRYLLGIHGGAGTILRENSTLEQQEAYRKALRSALLAGYHVLKIGGEAMDAAVAAATVLEDCPLFNAGKGAVFNIDGKKYPSCFPSHPRLIRTGDGDYFIRQATASTIAHRIKFLGEPLTHATEKAVESLLRDGALGGVIALDASGNVVMPMNSPGMYRGVIDEDGMAKTAIFSDDVLT